MGSSGRKEERACNPDSNNLAFKAFRTVRHIKARADALYLICSSCGVNNKIIESIAISQLLERSLSFIIEKGRN